MDPTTERKLKDLIRTNDLERVIQALELAEALGAEEEWFQYNLTGFLYNYFYSKNFGDMSEIEDVLSLIKTYNIKKLQERAFWQNSSLYWHLRSEFELMNRNGKGLISLKKKCLAAVREYCDGAGIDRRVGDLLFNIGGRYKCNMTIWENHLTEQGATAQTIKFISERVQ